MFRFTCDAFLCLVSYRAAFGAVVVDDGARMFVESIQPLADGFLVVVDASGCQTAAQKSLGHRLVADFEVKHQSARIDLGLELNSIFPLASRTETCFRQQVIVIFHLKISHNWLQTTSRPTGGIIL